MQINFVNASIEDKHTICEHRLWLHYNFRSPFHLNQRFEKADK